MDGDEKKRQKDNRLREVKLRNNLQKEQNVHKQTNLVRMTLNVGTVRASSLAHYVQVIAMRNTVLKAKQSMLLIYRPIVLQALSGWFTS